MGWNACQVFQKKGVPHEKYKKKFYQGATIIINFDLVALVVGNSISLKQLLKVLDQFWYNSTEIHTWGSGRKTHANSHFIPHSIRNMFIVLT